MKESKSPSQIWFTLREASLYLRISPRSIHRAMARGKLRRNKVEGRYLFRRNWLEQYACNFGTRLSRAQRKEIQGLID
jgi:hypothetical protein